MCWLYMPNGDEDSERASRSRKRGSDFRGNYPQQGESGLQPLWASREKIIAGPGARWRGLAPSLVLIWYSLAMPALALILLYDCFSNVNTTNASRL